MFNIVTVSNKSYQEFLIYFISSLFKNCNTNNLNKIYVLNNGIDDDIKNKLSNKSNKIIFCENNNKQHSITKSGWSNDWGYNVDTKTLFLLDILEKDNLPTFLIDVDCLFLKDFTEIIDYKKDVILCDREYSDNRIIASFVYLNNTKNAIDFLKSWIHEQTLIENYPKETKCLNKITKDYFNKIDIGLMSFKIINFYYTPSSNEEKEKIYIVHLKGAVKKDTFEEEIKNRINRLNNFINISEYYV